MCWFYRLTGGRPMTPAPNIGNGFTDRVSGDVVRYWQDYYGRYWMAVSRWSWFRVFAGVQLPQERRIARWDSTLRR